MIKFARNLNPCNFLKPKELSNQIKQKAQELGFQDCGIARARRLDEHEPYLKEWLSQNMQGEMGYMERNLEKRLDPRELVPGAKSVIIVTQNYYSTANQDPQAPKISKYAWGKDYHEVVKKKLWALAEFIKTLTGTFNGRVFTDTAPVLERAWFQEAGLGWIGKNTNAISTSYGSYFFIGELIVDTPLAYDSPTTQDYCGTCTRCMDACPTGAILKPRQVNANQCISYWTIEHPGPFNEKTPENFAQHIFGCDICQEVCPWNKKAIPHREPQFTPSPALQKMSSEDWRQLSEEQFREIFRKTTVKRTKYKGLKRNILYLYKNRKRYE